jgi:phosphopantothenoylcysteine decarboxylase/phosphopantothenate--cysteine ligase
MSLQNKKVLLIIGGGISAYKALDLIRLLVKNNVEVRTILTKSGKEFVTPLSIISLSNNKVFEDIFDVNNEKEIDHISLSRWADIILVLPTTANMMTKLSLGKAEDLATTVVLASNKNILLVPAMNVRMWLHKATQNNLKTLLDFGYRTRKW